MNWNSSERGQNVMELRRVAETVSVIATMAVITGCAQQRPVVEPAVVVRQPYVMAVRYEVEPSMHRPGPGYC